MFEVLGEYLQKEQSDLEIFLRWENDHWTPDSDWVKLVKANYIEGN